LPDLDNLPEEKSEDESESERKRSPFVRTDPDEEEAAIDSNGPRLADDTPQIFPRVRALPKKGDWVVVLGGASSVGKYAIQVRSSNHPFHNSIEVLTTSSPQLAKAAGYNVAASSSANSAEVRSPSP
jgi:hypothetical protein